MNMQLFHCASYIAQDIAGTETRNTKNNTKLGQEQAPLLCNLATL